MLNTESVANMFYALNEALNSLYDLIGKAIFLSWSKSIQVMIHDVIFEYCDGLINNLGNVS